MRLVCFLLIACSPTVQGRALAPSVKGKRVAVTGRGYTQGVESSLLALAGGRLTVFARHEQKAMLKEKELQYGGDFSDDAMVGLGKQLGAELLFVVRDETQKHEQRDQPMLENCSFNYGDSPMDSPDERVKKQKARSECEARNDTEKKRAADAPPRYYHRYKINVRVVDIQTGEMIAFGDADVLDGQAGMTCVYPCTRDKASELAVRAILGLSTN